MSFAFKAITSIDGLASLKEFWQAHQNHPNADWEFFQIIVEARHNVLAPCVIVASEGETIVALVAGRIENAQLPLTFGYAHLANVGIRQLVSIHGGFIGQWNSELYRRFLTFLPDFLSQERLDLALITQVRQSSGLHDILLQNPHRGCVLPVREPSRHWTMRLPGTWADFLAARSKKHRYWIKRLSSVLDREFPNKWSVQRYTTAREVPFFLKSAAAIADTTYHRPLGVGILANLENIRRLELEAGRGQLRGYLLFIAGKPSAFWYCATYGTTLHLCWTGYDPAFSGFELGTVLLMQVFSDHCGSDIRDVDFGLGDAAYKQRFGTETYTETSFLFFTRGFRGRTLHLTSVLINRCNKIIRQLLDRLYLTQALKTLWRRRLTSRGQHEPLASLSGSPPQNDTASSDQTS